jgi:hypothetical protein
MILAAPPSWPAGRHAWRGSVRSWTGPGGGGWCALFLCLCDMMVPVPNPICGKRPIGRKGCRLRRRAHALGRASRQGRA